MHMAALRTPTFFVAILTLFVVPLAHAQTTALVLNSEPGDYIGGGIDQTFTEEDGAFTARRNLPNVISISFDGGPHWWFLDFAAPMDVPLAVGVYDEATRFPFQSPTKPGLSVSGEGRGCNELTGQFEVLEVVYSPAGDVERFAATFEQHCEGMEPALTGSILINSTLPGPPQSAVRCRGAVATIHGLLGEVNALATSRASKALLRDFLTHAQAAIEQERPRLARQKVAFFSGYAVSLSTLPLRNRHRVRVPAANSLACGAANVLMNIPAR
jgi:hypothetical protein